MTLLMDTPTQVQQNRKVYDWRELVEAIEQGASLPKQTDLSRHVISSLPPTPGRTAQLTERVYAIANTNCIHLRYAHVPPGCGPEALELQQGVAVFPCQGGRTTYECNANVNGWFANTHLPMRAKDRGNKSVYRNTKWYYGSSGVYSPGIGPMYPDAGPEFRNLQLPQLLSMIEDATLPDRAWKDAAKSVLERTKDAITPFGDAILRYEISGMDSDPEACCFVGSSWIGGREYETHCTFGVRVRVKHPAKAGDGRGWNHTPDLMLNICGPSLSWENPDPISYVIGFCHPGMVSRACRLCHDDDVRHGLSWAATTNGKSAIEAVRVWCANNLYIPA